MTREEKTNLLNELLKYEENNDIGNLTRAERREFQQWISEALEQEPILDKIRAEIEELPTSRFTEAYRIRFSADNFKKKVLEILDRYKAEDEPQEVRKRHE